VLLHGDFVPSNLVVTAPDQVTMLDPTLVRTAPPEEDLARFLAVLSSDTAFVPGIALPPVRRLRRALERDFRAAYGLPAGGSVLLELSLVKQLVLRWLRRREHSRLSGRSRAMAVRRALVDRHMAALVAESGRRLARYRREGAR
jgi:aminoglycoside phosphotransferase (APT) family kinase protein